MVKKRAHSNISCNDVPVETSAPEARTTRTAQKLARRHVTRRAHCNISCNNAPVISGTQAMEKRAGRMGKKRAHHNISSDSVPVESLAKTRTKTRS
jgi:hypothetical protein